MKRFYDKVSLRGEAGSVAVLLDGKPVKTPLKSRMHAPTQGLADAIAGEWEAQGEKIETHTMPMTGLLTTSIDRVGRERAAVEAIITDYARSDLLCYRAEGGELAARQAAHWDPVLAWAMAAHDLRFLVTVGVMPVAQPAKTIETAAALLPPMSDCCLAGFGQIAHILGSVLLAHALAGGKLDTETAWAASRLDEDWQAEQWGRDAEAEARSARLKAELGDAVRFLELTAKV